MSVIIPLGVCVFCRMPLLKEQTPCQSPKSRTGPSRSPRAGERMMSERRLLPDGAGVALKELNQCAWR
jgi:hypothetical protein